VDITFGTNNMGMDLYAVLAEVDGTDAPLTCCFMPAFGDNCKGKLAADPRATIDLLYQFLRHSAGLDPGFFKLGRGSSEILAICHVWRYSFGCLNESNFGPGNLNPDS
jgi:hypothetical protein